MSSRFTEYPIHPNSVPSHEEIVAALREHLDDADAEMLALRYQNIERDAEGAVDWETAKRRILSNKQKPKP